MIGSIVYNILKFLNVKIKFIEIFIVIDPFCHPKVKSSDSSISKNEVI